MGCALAGFWLPYAWGVAETLARPGALNLAAALTALVAAAPLRPTPQASTPAPVALRLPRMWLALAFGSGLLMALAQVLWGRESCSLQRGAFQAYSLDPAEALSRGMLRSTSLEQLTIVEIDGDQYGAAALFGQEAVLDDPRVEARVDDALHYLSTTSRHFDVIAVDAWGPEISPGPFTEEFHTLALTHLTEDGLVWTKLSALTPDSLRGPLDAVRCTFPWATLREGLPTALVGSRIPLAGEVALPGDEPCAPLRFLYPRHFTLDGEGDRQRGRRASPGGTKQQAAAPFPYPYPFPGPLVPRPPGRCFSLALALARGVSSGNPRSRSSPAAPDQL